MSDGLKTRAGFLSRGLSLDLEVGRNDERIHQFAAVRCDNGRSLSFGRGDLQAELRKLDQFADGLDYLVGHNLVAFDAVHLAAANPRLQILKLPFVDTLQLNPLAFPRNPYHHLVKHYHDGQLKRVQLNDPKLDAQLTQPGALIAQKYLRHKSSKQSFQNVFWGTVVLNCCGLVFVLMNPEVLWR